MELLLNKGITVEGDIQNAAKIFNLGPEHLAQIINMMTAERSEVVIRPFEAATLAALEEQANLAYGQSLILRYF